jgi:hypothetical protein
MGPEVLVVGEAAWERVSSSTCRRRQLGLLLPPLLLLLLLLLLPLLWVPPGITHATDLLHVMPLRKH